MSEAKWWTLAAVVFGASGLASRLTDLRAGHDLGLGFGIAAAILMLWAALLGLRKRWLRLRVGSVTAWASAHNALGALVLGLGLLHAGFGLGGFVSAALVGVLVATFVTGVVGMVLQFNLPRLLAARRLDLPPTADPERAIVEAWRRAHDLVVEVCGPTAGIERALCEAEAGVGLASAEASTASAAPGHHALGLFYADVAFPFLQRPAGSRSPLRQEATARLAFDALRTHVSAPQRPTVDGVQAACREARLRTEELRLQRWLFGWQLLHIPLGIAGVVLLAAHVLAALYY